MSGDIIVGSEAQIGMVRRARALHRLLRNDPRFGFRARAVSFLGYTSDAVATVIDHARRGKSLACWVGAEAILALHDRFGANGFSSGVKPDKAESQAMCARLGITRSEFIFAGGADPALMGSGPVTR